MSVFLKKYLAKILSTFEFGWEHSNRSVMSVPRATSSHWDPPGSLSCCSCAPSSGQHCNCFLRTSVKNRELGLQNTSHRFLHNKLTEFIRIAEGCPWNGQGEFGDQSSVGSVESMSAPFKVLRDFQDFQDFQHEKTESKSKRGGGVGLGQQVPYRQLKLS